jgi:glycosyltransferase involved in cell wall biosynthesis
MPDILILCEYPTLNGGERSMLATLDGVLAAGFTPVVMAPGEGPLAEAVTARGLELLPFQCRAPDRSRIAQSHLREELAAVLSRRRPALLHANSLAMGRLSGPVAAECRLPSIAHLRDIVGLSAKAVADLNCHRRLLAVSEATRQFHLAQGIDADKTHVVYNGVDLEQFRPRPPTSYLHRELGLSLDAQLVGNIGQLGLRKGQDMLLRAATLIHDSQYHRSDNNTPTSGADTLVCPARRSSTGRQECLPHSVENVHYLIVGERNSDKDESRQFELALRQAASGPLAGRVHFLGRRVDVPLLLNELTLLVHAARQEPLGRVLLEAAASGIAIVATDVGGTREICPPETDTARLVPPDDPGRLAAAMLELLGDGELRTRLGAAARGRARQRFDIRTSAEDLVNQYLAAAE